MSKDKGGKIGPGIKIIENDKIGPGIKTIENKRIPQFSGSAQASKASGLNDFDADILESDVLVLEKKYHSKGLKNRLIIIGVIVALAIVSTIVIPILMNSKDDNNNNNNPGLFYLKSGELLYSANLTGDDSQVVAKELDTDMNKFNDLGVNDKEGITDSYNNTAVCSFVTVDKRESKVLYIDETKSKGSKTLYVAGLAGTTAKPRIIDNGIVSYIATPSLSRVLYVKQDVETRMYIDDLEDDKTDDKIQIDIDIRSYHAAHDLSKIVYDKNSGGVYIKNNGSSEPRMIDATGFIRYVNPKFNTVFFNKENEDSLISLYVWKEGKGAAKEIANGITVEENYFYEDGTCYYTKFEERESNLYAFVNDDKLEEDETLVEPETPVYPPEPNYYDYTANSGTDNSYYNNESNDTDTAAAEADYEKDHKEWEENVEAINKKYEEDMTRYNEKLQRDYLREDLKAEPRTVQDRILYYYDGSTSILVSKVFGKFFGGAEKRGIVTYQTYQYDQNKGPMLSTITNLDDVAKDIESGYSYGNELLIAVSGKENKLDNASTINPLFSKDGKYIWYWGHYSNEKEIGTLFRAKIPDGTIGKSGQLDVDVSHIYNYVTPDESVIYFKKYNENSKTGDCYINGTLAKEDVATGSIAVDKDCKTYYFLSGYNDETGVGVLESFTDGQVNEIAKNVRSFLILKSGEIVVLRDYSFAKKQGDLYLYNSKNEATKLDDNVNLLIPPRNEENRYSYVRDLLYFDEYFYFDVPGVIAASASDKNEGKNA